MKTILTIAICTMFFLIACDVEENANKTVLNYTTTIILLPFLSLAIYAITHPDEIKKFEK